MLRRQSEVADAIDQYGVNAVLCVYGWLLIIFVVLLFMRLFNSVFGGAVEQSKRLITRVLE
jgi:hypothetical protein